MAKKPTPGQPPASQPTRRVRRVDPTRADPSTDSTDYELSPSVFLPPVRLDATKIRLLAPDEPSSTHLRAGGLDPAGEMLFQQRLRLCCLVAAVPFLFIFISSLTGFIELFSRAVVGWPGVALSGTVFFGLLATAFALWQFRQMPENALRAFEIAIFGVMAMFFAYWQFSLLTADLLNTTKTGETSRIDRPDEYRVLAAALIVHFNWFALIVFHGVLVPNTLARGIGVVLAMSIVALAIDGAASILHAPTGQNSGVLFAISGTMLLAGAGLAIFGTAKTAALRQEVESARQAVRELGQYRLRRKLGQGGMGEVYLAEHRLLKRPCAIKRIHPKYLNSPEQVKRFEREVQTTAQLRHPNTVEVYDYGRAEDGTFYYVMEYLSGLSLEELIARHGPMPADRVVHILRQVVGALREAHGLGLIHRDIKPSNVLVLTEGSPHDQAKLVDFGLVQSLAVETDPEAKITRDGLIVGTPEYMSPEQAQGMPLDARSDLFSLGTVAYFLLTGREAFHRDNPVRTLLAVVNEEPTPISTHNPFVPEDLAKVVNRCMLKSLDKRFARASELEAALDACECAHGWTERRALEWWQSNPKGDTTGTDLNTLPME